MIKIESFAKQNKSNVSNSSGGFVKSTTIINNSTTTEVSKELDTHLLWGQPFNGIQDVSGDLVGVGNISANGNISTTGNINGNTVSGATVSATNVNATNVDADNGTIDNLTTETLNSQDINNSGDISTDGLTANTGTITTLVSTDGTITNLTVDNLTAKAAHFFELTIDEIKSVGGQLIVTPANASIDKVEKIGNTYKCYFKSTDGEKKITNQFAVNDQVVCSSFNAATGTSYNVSNKFYWAKVSQVSSAPVTVDGEEYHYIIVDWTDKDSDSNGVPQEGDKIAQLGNRNNTARQAAIIISAYQNQFLDNGISAPSIVQYEGINDYNLSNHRLNVISKGLNQFKGSFTTSTGDDIVDLINDMGEGALTYVHSAYANSADGATDFSKTYFDNAEYMGLCSNHTESDTALTYTDYRWSRFKGSDGTDGLTPFIYNGNWWIGTTDTGVEAKGEQGDTPYINNGYWYIGTDSTGVKATGDTPYIKNGYWWIGNTNTNVKAQGIDGTTYYTWIRYADTISSDGTSGTGISNSPIKGDGTFKEHIGFAYNKTSATESNNYADYKWSLFKGTDGTDGIDGIDGKTLYTWLKYSDVLPTKNSDIYDSPKSTTEYIGIATNQENQTESGDYTKYIWSKFKGEQGIPGTDGNTPYIKNGNWWIGNTDTQVKAEGTNGDTPRIVNGYWWVGDVNTGVKAEGTDGSTPYIENGYWYINGVSLDVKATGDNGNDAEFYRLVKNVEKAIVDKDGTLGISLQYQIVHIVGSTITNVTANTNDYWVRFKTDASSTYYNLSTNTTTPKYSNANFITNYHKATSRPIYLSVQLMYQSNTVKDTLVVPIIFDAAATLTITDEIKATVQANKTEIDGELETISNDLTEVSQKADGLETTVSNHTTTISNLNSTVQSHTTSISNLNQRADSISARVQTNAENISDNTEAIAQLVIDTDGISTEVAKNTTDISNLYADPNLFGIATYCGSKTDTNKFFIKNGTATITSGYVDKYNTFIHNENFDCVQFGNGNSGIYTPYVKLEANTNYTLTFDNLNVESASRIDYQIVTYSSEYDAKNDKNGNIGTFKYINLSEDMYEEKVIERFSDTIGWKRIKIKITCTGVSSDNEAYIYGSGIRLYKGSFTNWDDLPKTAAIIKDVSSSINQTATEITTTVNRNVIETMNLLEQTNFDSLDNMDKWHNNTNLSGVIETGVNGVNAYKVNITGSNQIFLSQLIYKNDLSVAKIMPMRKYTFSCYFKDIATGTQPTEMNNVTFCICNSTDYATSANNIYADEFIYTNTNEDWQYFKTTFSTPQSFVTNYYLVIRCANMQTAGTFYICMPKLEIGEVATEYTQEVSDASSSVIQQTADKIRLQVENCGIDITNSKITLNGNTEVNGSLTISDEDTGFVLQGEGGATQISPKSVGNYDDFITNSTTNVTQSSNGYGINTAEGTNYFTFTFNNSFNLGRIGSGKSITITPSTQTFYKDFGSGDKIDITNKIFNKSNRIRIYENWVLQRTETSYSTFTYVSKGTGIIAVYIDTECSVSKSEVDRGTGKLVADVSNTTNLSWTVPNDAYTLLGYDGLGLNFGTSANAFINKDNAIFRYGSAGLRISVNGVTKWNGSEWVNILTPSVYRLTGTSYVWGNSEYDILVTTSSNAVSVTLPSNPYTGRMVYIRKAGSGNISVSANKTMRSGYSGTVTTYTVNNSKLCSFLYDGTMWLINYET